MPWTQGCITRAISATNLLSSSRCSMTALATTAEIVLFFIGRSSADATTAVIRTWAPSSLAWWRSFCRLCVCDPTQGHPTYDALVGLLCSQNWRRYHLQAVLPWCAKEGKRDLDVTSLFEVRGDRVFVVPTQHQTKLAHAGAARLLPQANAKGKFLINEVVRMAVLALEFTGTAME